MEFLQPSVRWLKVHGLRLHYLDWRNDKGQPLLLFHVFLAHAHLWGDFARYFRSCYQILALDQRGHGKSQWSEEGPYTITYHFQHLTEFTETLELKRLTLIGHSMGGRNALLYVACISTYREGLMPIDASPGENCRAAQMLRYLLLILPYQARSIQAAVAIRSIYPNLSTLHAVLSSSMDSGREPGGKLTPRNDFTMSQQMEQNDYQTEGQWFLLKTTQCHILIFRRSQSPFLSRAGAEKVRRAIPTADFREIQKSTHIPSHKKPEAFYQVISRFLNKRIP